jgi:hypothetical protein
LLENKHTMLEEIMNEKGWFFLDIKINLPYFIRKFGKVGVSGWYRNISNSQHIFLGKTNRDFFKSNFAEGFYRYSIYNDEVNIVLFLKSKEFDNQERLIKELIIRIKKLLFVKINVGEMDEITSEDKMLLSSKDGLRNYQKILETYSK